MRHARSGVLIFAIGGLAACRPMESPELSAADLSAVNATRDAYRTNALAGTWDEWGKIFATNVVYMPPNMQPLMGRDAAVAFGKGFPKLTSLTLTADEVHGRGDLAIDRGRYAYSAMMPDGSTVSDSGSFVNVYRKQADGTWPYTHVIWHSNLPVPVPPPPAE